MSHLKAILFRRDRLWLAVLLGTVSLAVIAVYSFYFTQTQQADAFTTAGAGYSNNGAAADTVIPGEEVLVLDVTLPTPTVDTLVHNGAGFVVAAENLLTNFGVNDKFADNDHANDYDDGEAVVRSADAVISNGEVVTAGLADMMSFQNDDANVKFGDTDNDNDTADYSGVELIVRSADTTISAGEVVTTGEANLTAFDVAEPGIEIFADDGTDNNTLDSNEDIYRQIHNGADVFASGLLLEDFAATEMFTDNDLGGAYDDGVAILTSADADITEGALDGSGIDTVITDGLAALSPINATNAKFADNDNDGLFDAGEAIVISADANLTAGVLSGAGTDQVFASDTGTADLTAFAATIMFADNDGGADYDNGEAIINDADADGMPTAGDSVVTSGTAGVVAFEAADAVYLEDVVVADGEYTATEIIWKDTNANGTYEALADYVLVGGAAPVCAPGTCFEVSAIAQEAGLAFLDVNLDGIFDSAQNTNAETIIWFGVAVNPTTGDSITAAVTFFDPANLVADDIAGTWVENLTAFAATVLFADAAHTGSYINGQAIVSSVDANLDSGDTVVTTGAADLIVFIGNDYYCENGVAGYEGTEAILNSADVILSSVGDVVTETGTCNLTTFSATQFFVSAGESYADGDDIFDRLVDGGAAGGDEAEVRLLNGNNKFSDADHDGVFDAAELVAISADANLADGEVVLAGTVDITAFSATFRWSDANDGTTYTDGELIGETFGEDLNDGEIKKSGLVDVIAFDSSSSPFYKYHDGDSDLTYDDGEDIVTDDDNSGYYNADQVTGILISNAGTAIDADLQALNVYEDTNDNGTLNIGAGDFIILNDVDGTYFNSAEAFFGATYISGAGNQRLFVTATIAVAPTNARTIQARLADAACVTDGDAGCAVRLASTVDSAVSGDGPSDLNITNAFVQTIDSALPTITAIYTLDGFDPASATDACSSAANIDVDTIDGIVDALCIDFSEAVDDSSITLANFTVAGETIGSVDTSGSADDDIVFFLLTDDIYATDGLPNVAYAAGTLTDLPGNLMATDATNASTDTAPPAILSTTSLDANGDGTVDQVEIAFSESARVVDGIAGDGFAPLAIEEFGVGALTVSNANYSSAATSTLTLNITGVTANDTGVTIFATYDDDTLSGQAICDASVSAGNCVVDYPTQNQMFDGSYVQPGSLVDGASPVIHPILGAKTTSEDDIEITFTESVENAAFSDLTTNGGTVNFGAVSAATGTTITWQNATSDWATDATGSDAGDGFDSEGDNTGIIPNLTMAAGAVVDESGNLSPLIANDARTTDGAEAVVYDSAIYLDTDNDGDVDRVDLGFSEDVLLTGYNTADWTQPADGDFNASDSGVLAIGREIRVTVVADASKTGSVDPFTILYTNNAGRLTDDAVSPNASSTFGGALTVDDQAAPVQLSANYQDSDADGDVDRLVIVTSADPSLACTYEAVDWSIPVAGTNGLALNGGTTCAVVGITSIRLNNLTGDANETGGVTAPTVLYANAGVASSVTDGTNAMAAWGGALTASDSASPKILSGVYQDSDSDGDVDRAVLTSTADTGLVCTAFVMPGAVTVGTAGSVGLTVAGGATCASNGTSTFTVNFTTNGTANTTGGATNPIITYTQPGNGLEDGAGNDLATTAGLTLTDNASPRIVTKRTRDGDADGQIDGADVVFTESVSDATFGAGAGGWAVAAPYVGEAIVTGAVANDSAVRVTFTENGTADTDAVPTIAYTAGTLADASANLVATAAAAALTDYAAPVIVSTSPEDNENNVEDDSTIVVTFSEPMTTGATAAAFSILPNPSGAEVFAWSGADKIATITPSSTFDRNETYVVTFAATALSVAGGDPDLTATSFDFDTEGSSSGGGGGGGGGGGTSSTTPAISITSPTGSDSFEGGDVVTIDWAVTGSGVSTVKLYYSVDGGDHYTSLASGLSKSATYDWTVPNTDTDTAIIKAVAMDSGSATLDTDVTGEFSISLNTSMPEDEVTADDDEDELMSRSDANDALPSSISVDDLVRGTLPAVYYIGLDAKRHPFPNEQIYMTWFENFDNVQVISDSDLADISLGTPVLTRPGTLMVKIVSDPKTYIVEPGYVLRWVTTEEAAIALFGSTWNQRVMDIEPTYFSHFSFGDDITDGTYPSGSLVKSSTSSTVFYIDGDTRREVDADGMSENYFQDRFVTVNDDGDWMDLDLGSTISGLEDALFSSQLP